ncbi:hypothetical protein QTP70_011190 [Hemibagrus guttatus]|uniref:Uncharacterized protein n=1 Tax=Hemibagrus guttatus TaxID=175788 RepID=A0AAE0QQ03_9TELE|nr:hypothetical protein QTP70_011190 [Hemibagrus guttatus]
MGKHKDLRHFDKGQIVMARRLGQSISKTAGLVGYTVYSWYMMKGEGIGGPVVGFSPTMRKARVQFPANAQTPATGCSAGPKPSKKWEGCVRKGIRRKTCAKLLCRPAVATSSWSGGVMVDPLLFLSGEHWLQGKFTVYFKSLTLVIPPECIVVYCGVLGVYCGVLGVYCGVLWCIVVYCGVLSVLWCIVVYCGVLGVYYECIVECIVVYCGVLGVYYECIVVYCGVYYECIVVYCGVL